MARSAMSRSCWCGPIAASPARAGMRGKAMAWSDPNFASGYLIPRFALRRQGINPEQYFGRTGFAGGHEQAVIAVLQSSTTRAVDLGLAARARSMRLHPRHAAGDGREGPAGHARAAGHLDARTRSSTGRRPCAPTCPSPSRRTCGLFHLALPRAHPDIYSQIERGGGAGYREVPASDYVFDGRDAGGRRRWSAGGGTERARWLEAPCAGGLNRLRQRAAVLAGEAPQAALRQRRRGDAVGVVILLACLLCRRLGERGRGPRRCRSAPRASANISARILPSLRWATLFAGTETDGSLAPGSTALDTGPGCCWRPPTWRRWRLCWAPRAGLLLAFPAARNLGAGTLAVPARAAGAGGDAGRCPRSSSR